MKVKLIKIILNYFNKHVNYFSLSIKSPFLIDFYLFLSKTYPLYSMATETTTCKNCENQFEESFEFCPHCGQKSNDELTMKVLFHNTISNYFSVDARFLKSFVPLMIKPGFLPKKFVEGKRLTYLHPAQTYLFVSVVFFFLFSFEVREQQQAVDQIWNSGMEKSETITNSMNEGTLSAEKIREANVKKNIGPFISYSSNTEDSSKEKANATQNNKEGNINMEQSEIDSLIAVGASQNEILKSMGMSDNPGAFQRKFYEQILKVYKQRGGGILQAFYNTFPIAMFFLLPVFGFLLKLFYSKNGPFAYHMVFSFYFFSFLFVVFSALLLLNFIWAIPEWIDNLILFSTFFYLLLGVKRFYGKGYFVSFIKSSLVAFLFFVLVMPLSVVIMMLVAFMFY